MNRMDRINQQIKREISSILQRELSNPRFQFVSITQVDTSKDLRTARVYFSILGGADQLPVIEEGLIKAAGLIRKHVGKRMMIRLTPELHFIYDDTMAVSSALDQVFREINDDKKTDH